MIRDATKNFGWQQRQIPDEETAYFLKEADEAAAHAERLIQEGRDSDDPEIKEWEECVADYRKWSEDSWVLWVTSDGNEFCVGRYSDAEYEAHQALQRESPQAVADYDDEQRYWQFKDRFYFADSDLTADDVRALLASKDVRRKRQLDHAHAVAAMGDRLDDRARRQPIPREIKTAVWVRDGGACVECGAKHELEFDHLIPLAMGGSNTERNLQLLCAACNRRKGATLG